MVNNLLTVLITLLLLCIIGYFLVVLKEKFYLKNHIILIEHKDVEPDILENIDVKHFMLGSIEVMAGDEVKIHMDNSTRVKGIVLGIIKSENSIALATTSKGVTNLKVSSIKKLKVISRYGKFFAKF
ncbi:hypothetical protein [Alkaliphilus transvaalensis]|uniref:hypothetical protein n=1 Tax=Alkaliphilus transvaalensis TaxID=114628 RepID=UPI00047E1D18|nr:hypothetical protein [Alkaliphilus transvaalensis]